MVQKKTVSRPAAATKHDALHGELRSLQAALGDSGTLSNSQKRQLSAEIEKMTEHLGTPTPSGHVLRTIWSGIEHLVTAGDFVEHAVRIGAILAELTV